MRCPSLPSWVLLSASCQLEGRYVQGRIFISDSLGFMAEWRSTLLKAVTMWPPLYFVSFNRSRKIPAVLNGGMRIKNSGAEPPRNRVDALSSSPAILS